jgi:hypothetical protein
MDPEHMKWIASEVKRTLLVLPKGSHPFVYDDPKTYFWRNKVLERC